jgi:L-asparagine transporter-like permease
MSMNDTLSNIIERERGLRRNLSARKLSMIALGGAIGTGLFLGTAFSISLAGPAALVSYALSALLTVLLVGCLAEMTLAHPTSGSFGAYAEHYLGPLAGFLVRYAYWAATIFAVGSEVAAIALYMKFWLPHSPGWLWSAGFSAVLVLANLANVGAFGTIEYWFSWLKLTAIGLFILIAGGFLLESNLPFAASGPVSIGFQHYVDHGGFLPNGLGGIGGAVLVAIFSYLGIEMVAVAAGEAEQPEVAIKQAFRTAVVRLILFYLLTVALLLAIVPWSDMAPGVSPFVLAMQKLHIPGAAGLVNFVILIAALSAVNSQLYIATRMMFSLARAGDAPRALGSINPRGIPVNALLASTLGIAVATILSVVSPGSAYLALVAIALFGALFTWLMIFVTHYFFRRERVRMERAPLGFQMVGFPAITLLGAAAMLAVLLGTLLSPPFHLTLIFGLAFLACMTLAYFIRNAIRPQPQPEASS